MIREHLAGDLLPHRTDKELTEHVVATGFLVLGATNYEQQDKTLLRMDVIDEQIDTMGRAFLGMTLNCARCHDHKFDPIPTNDYYALAGIFGSTNTLTYGNVSGWVTKELPLEPEIERDLQQMRKRLDEAMPELEAVRKQISAASSDKDKQAHAPQEKELKTEVIALREKIARLVEEAMSVSEIEKPQDGHLHIRGSAHNVGPEVKRGFLSVVPSSAEFAQQIDNEQSGRLQLANWVVDEQNPLTARVYVNRVWQHLLGEGLVRTPDNFGKTGEQPSHPELLDYLAIRFIEEGWSTKQLIREIMLTRVYRLSTTYNAKAAHVDSDNRLLWRAHKRRLDAESIRDTILYLSGQLDLTAGGFTIRKLAEYDYGYEFDTVRRSVYVPVFRNAMLDLFEVFDVANPNLVVGRRTASTLPTQSLF
ncbi:MAG: DUF1553 domain-containing protein [Planctomycetaceae bacterium]